RTAGSVSGAQQVSLWPLHVGPAAHGAVPAAHPVERHRSTPSQKRPSSQSASFGKNWQLSLASSQVSAVQATPSLHGGTPAEHVPPMHRSAPLQNRPSLQ